ncbi:ArsR family transcriptional regulator [Candidatus Woesearchaeota archaeon]|nr:MAG: ArsR family transcriptional regulator [Candidatus Woesearchaeota archaeon]
MIIVEPAKLLMGLFDQKRLRLIKLFLDNPENEYGLREAAKSARLPPATTHRIMKVLLKYGVVEERRVKKLRLYKLSRSKQAKFLDELLAVKKTAIEEFVERAGALEGVEFLILHGKATKEKAGILVVGHDIDSSALNGVVGEIKDKYKFSIIHTTLAREQYEQMTAMGLFPQEKKVLYGARI